MLQDLRYSVRVLRRSPAFAASAILALALGTGANTAVFSVFHAVLLKPLPYPEPERLVRLYEQNIAHGVDRGDVSPGTFVDWRSRARTLDSVAVHTGPGPGLWSFGDRLQLVQTAPVSPAIFPMLRVAPALGRTFRAEPEQEKPYGDQGEVIISHTLWQRHFGGALDVVGRTIRVEGRYPLQIVGVMPRGFAFPEGAEAWTNLAFVRPVGAGQRQARYYQAVGRLAAGATIADARADLAAISSQLIVEQPGSNAGWTAQIEPLAESSTRGSRPALLALLAAAGGVLLIACANVANLLLARATSRRREMAVRAALGAGTSRLVRHLFAEALLLAAAGTTAGLALGAWLARILVHIAPAGVPRLAGVEMNGPLLLFAVTAGCATTAVIGLAPAVEAWRAQSSGGLRPGSRAATDRGAWTRRLLVAGEVAVVVLLLTASALLVRSFVKLQGVDLGFAPERVLAVEMRWPTGRFATASRRPWYLLQQAVDGVMAEVRSLPGVEAAGMITDIPLADEAPEGSVWLAESEGVSAATPPPSATEQWNAGISIVTPGYFDALRIPLFRGRQFGDADRFTEAELISPDVSGRQGVVIVNTAFASRYFPGQDPLGRRLAISDDQTFASSRVIVGVVGNARARSVAEAAAPAVFLPHGQHPGVFRPSVVIRSPLPPEGLAAALGARLRGFDPQLLVLRTRTMSDVVSGSLSRPRFNLLLVGAFALVALALSAVGIYGVVAFVVTRRTREIGIRMALGARSADVRRLVLRDGMAPVLGGAAAGMAASFGVTRAMRSLLFGVEPLDPISFAAAPLLVAVVALAACYLPARRATRVDPLVALQED